MGLRKKRRLRIERNLNIAYRKDAKNTKRMKYFRIGARVKSVTRILMGYFTGQANDSKKIHTLQQDIEMI